MLIVVKSIINSINCVVCNLNVSGQFEYVLNEQPGILGADHAFICKNGMKEMAAQHGMLANFMCRPWSDRWNIHHFNHSLWSEDLKTNEFYDAEHKNCFSEVAEHWLAGLCKHGRAITALCSPTTNGYRLMKDMAMYPQKSDWGLDNRDVAFRVKNHSHDGFLVENRIPAACNPYLVLAATVAAGLDGIKNKLPLPKEMDPAAESIPITLEEALTALQEDSVIVDALGPDLIRWFIESKQQIDLKIMSEFDPLNHDECLKKEREIYSLYV